LRGVEKDNSHQLNNKMKDDLEVREGETVREQSAELSKEIWSLREVGRGGGCRTVIHLGGGGRSHRVLNYSRFLVNMRVEEKNHRGKELQKKRECDLLV